MKGIIDWFLDGGLHQGVTADKWIKVRSIPEGSQWWIEGAFNNSLGGGMSRTLQCVLIAWLGQEKTGSVCSSLIGLVLPQSFDTFSHLSCENPKANSSVTIFFSYFGVSFFLHTFHRSSLGFCSAFCFSLIFYWVNEWVRTFMHACLCLCV